ncbi:retrovirus-related pol polyprotein from transposon TNT 1-94, partial [Tanacetum coccineum]
MKPFGCHVTILNTLDNLGKFDGKSDEGFFVGYSLSSKAFRVYNTRTRKVQENLHIGFLENKPMIEGNGPKWLFDIDSLTQSMNYVPVVAGTFSNNFAGIKKVSESSTSSQQDQDNQDCIVMPIWKDASYFGDAAPRSVADAQIQDKVGHTQEEGIDYDEVFAPVARIEAIRMFLAYASYMGFIVYQMHVKSDLLYGQIEEEVYVCQPPGFEDLDHPDKVYKVVKELYGLHQAPKA